jgi:hypothetical protein
MTVMVGLKLNCIGEKSANRSEKGMLKKTDCEFQE